MGDARVLAVLADLATAPIEEPLRATLAFLGKLTREPDRVTAAGVSALLALGVTRSQIEDALDVAFAFNVMNRLSSAFAFHVGPDAAFAAGARHLLKRGYR